MKMSDEEDGGGDAHRRRERVVGARSFEARRF
jgi:hypothetical protein